MAPLVLRSYLRMGARRIGANVRASVDVFEVDSDGLVASLRFDEDEVVATLTSTQEPSVLFRSALPQSMEAVGAWSQRQAANVLHAIESAQSGDRPTLEPLKLLIVDDEPVLRESLAHLLRAHDVAQAADVPQARSLLDQNRYDGILLDVMLPGTTGAELLDELYALDPSVADTVCLMTAEPGLVQNRTSTPVLVKPFTRDQLDTALNCIRAMGAWDEPDPPSPLV